MTKVPAKKKGNDELTLRAAVLGCVLSILVAMYSAYAGLKIGGVYWPMVTTAVVSLAIVRLLGGTAVARRGGAHSPQANREKKEWDWFDFPPAIAPYHAWVFPLMKKDGLDDKAREVEAALRESGLTVYYQDSGSIGRRYARADEIGVPYCITVDYDSLQNNDATVRFRNDGKQIRVKIGELAARINGFVREGRVSG